MLFLKINYRQFFISLIFVKTFLTSGFVDLKNIMHTINFFYCTNSFFGLNAISARVSPILHRPVLVSRPPRRRTFGTATPRELWTSTIRPSSVCFPVPRDTPKNWSCKLLVINLLHFVFFCKKSHFRNFRHSSSRRCCFAWPYRCLSAVLMGSQPVSHHDHGPLATLTTPSYLTSYLPS